MIGITAGSFDPITNGHLWVIERACSLFDTVVVGIGVNPDKKPLFSIEERADLILKSVSDHSKIKVVTFEKKFLVEVAKEHGAQFIIRGLRNSEDFGFEHTLRLVNERINSEIETIYLIPPRTLSEISSSIVKGLVGIDGWEKVVGNYVPEPVLNALKSERK